MIASPALLLAHGGASHAAPALETTRVRLVHDPSICVAPQYLAEDLLRVEGFKEIEYVAGTDGLGTKLIAAGRADVMMEFAGLYLRKIDAGDPIVLLGGVHIGCFEIFGGEDVRTVRDLRGKRIAVLGEDTPEHIFLSAVLAYVGLDPRKDVRWEAHSPEDSIQLLADGNVDAFAGFPPIPQELRRRGIGRRILSTTADRPWANYFCCMTGANRDFVRRNPLATKAILRAILKSADVCQSDPDGTAQFMVNRGYTGDPVQTAQALREIPYRRWRDYDPEDTIRFYGLRLREAGMVTRTPNRLLAEAAEWRFLRELKEELRN